jgi:hypothetical protein
LLDAKGRACTDAVQLDIPEKFYAFLLPAGFVAVGALSESDRD